MAADLRHICGLHVCGLHDTSEEWIWLCKYGALDDRWVNAASQRSQLRRQPKALVFSLMHTLPASCFAWQIFCMHAQPAEPGSVSRWRWLTMVIRSPQPWQKDLCPCREWGALPVWQSGVHLWAAGALPGHRYSLLIIPGCHTQCLQRYVTLERPAECGQLVIAEFHVLGASL